MAWTAPQTWSANVALTASLLNTYVRDNMALMAANITTTTGDYVVGTGANSIGRRAWGFASVGTAQTTTSATYTDLTTAGPSVTATTTAYAFVITRCRLWNTTASSNALASFAISGATTRAAQDNTKILIDGIAAGSSTDNFLQLANIDMLTSLTSGSNTFKMQYRCTSGTAGFSDRKIFVLPL